MPTITRDTPLHKAAHGGDLNEVKELVQAGEIGIDTPGASQRRPLHRASGSNHTGIILYLLSKNASLHSLDKSNRSALHYAVLAGHYESAKLLLEKGADVKGETAGGMNALHCAVYSGNERCVRIVCKYIVKAEVPAEERGTSLGGNSVSASGSFIGSLKNSVGGSSSALSITNGEIGIGEAFRLMTTKMDEDNKTPYMAALESKNKDTMLATLREFGDPNIITDRRTKKEKKVRKEKPIAIMTTPQSEQEQYPPATASSRARTPSFSTSKIPASKLSSFFFGCFSGNKKKKNDDMDLTDIGAG